MRELSRETQRATIKKMRKVDFGGHKVPIEYYQIEDLDVLTNKVLQDALTKGYLIFYNPHTGFYLSTVPITHYKIKESVSIKRNGDVFYSGGREGTLILNCMFGDNLNVSRIQEHLKKLPTCYCVRLVGKRVIICDYRKQIPVEPNFGAYLTKKLDLDLFIGAEVSKCKAREDFTSKLSLDKKGLEVFNADYFYKRVREYIIDIQNSSSFSYENIYYSKKNKCWVVGCSCPNIVKTELNSNFASYRALSSLLTKVSDSKMIYKLDHAVFESSLYLEELFKVLYNGLAVLHYNHLKGYWMLVGDVSDYTNNKLNVTFNTTTGNVMTVLEDKTI